MHRLFYDSKRSQKTSSIFSKSRYFLNFLGLCLLLAINWLTLTGVIIENVQYTVFAGEMRADTASGAYALLDAFLKKSELSGKTRSAFVDTSRLLTSLSRLLHTLRPLLLHRHAWCATLYIENLNMWGRDLLFKRYTGFRKKENYIQYWNYWSFSF